MRFRVERDRPRALVLRVFTRQGEIAYAVFGLRGVRADIEFPSDWHERRRAWIRLGCGFLSIAFSFPWSRVVPDCGQCSGPTYGFYFFDDSLVLQWGKSKGGWDGRRRDPIKHIQMPWGWRHVEHRTETVPRTYDYRYERESGEIQQRKATIAKETGTWWRPWLPWKMVKRSIKVDFDAEVGERTGSWKGGVMGCAYEMLPHESPLDCLRRMERERKFR